MRGKMRQCEELKKIFFYRNDEQMIHFFRGLKTDGSNIFVGSHLSNLNILPFLSLFLNICFLSAFNIALDSIQMSRLFRNQRLSWIQRKNYDNIAMISIYRNTNNHLFLNLRIKNWFVIDSTQFTTKKLITLILLICQLPAYLPCKSPACCCICVL